MMSGRLIFSPLGSVIMGAVVVEVGGDGIRSASLSGKGVCKSVSGRALSCEWEVMLAIDRWRLSRRARSYGGMFIVDRKERRM